MREIPVLVIGFNRPDLLRNLLNRLKQIGIFELYVSLDGSGVGNDSLACEECTDIVMNFRDSFNLHFIRRDYNLGCTLGVISAIDWFFENVQFGAILEDDCFPIDGFFEFIEDFEINKKIMDQQQINLITGHNPFDIRINRPESRAVLVHGWATHSDTWKKIRLGYFSLGLPTFLNKNFESRPIKETIFWWANSTRAKLGIVDTWDGMLNERVWKLGFKTLIPSKNLIINYGFGPRATHTKDPSGSNLVKLTDEIVSKNCLDELLANYYFGIKTRHIVSAIIRISLDFFRFNKRKKFDKILAHDRIYRDTIR
jgi:hypothetical protein